LFSLAKVFKLRPENKKKTYLISKKIHNTTTIQAIFIKINIPKFPYTLNNFLGSFCLSNLYKILKPHCEIHRIKIINKNKKMRSLIIMKNVDSL